MYHMNMNVEEEEVSNPRLVTAVGRLVHANRRELQSQFAHLFGDLDLDWFLLIFLSLRIAYFYYTTSTCNVDMGIFLLNYEKSN